MLDAEFSLKGKGYTSLVMMPADHRSVEDFNTGLLKSRLPLKTMLAEVYPSAQAGRPSELSSVCQILHH